MLDYQAFIDRHYPEGSRRREILMHHSRQVAEKAVGIARARELDVDLEQVYAAAMLHDIGICMTDAPGIDCYGEEPYLCHGVLGAAMLRDEGAPEWASRVAERHTGAGITADDVRRLGLPLPECDFMPQTLLERLVCYADKFYSKSADMREKSLERVRVSMLKISDETLARFEELHRQFGLSDNPEIQLTQNNPLIV